MGYEVEFNLPYFVVAPERKFIGGYVEYDLPRQKEGRQDAICFLIKDGNTSCQISQKIGSDGVAMPLGELPIGESVYVAERYMDVDDKGGPKSYGTVNWGEQIYPPVCKITPVAPPNA